MVPTLILTALLAQAQSSEAQPIRVPLALAGAGQASDIGTTCYALGSGRFREGNRLLPSRCLPIAVTKAATFAALALTTKAVGRTHPTAAKRLAWLLVAASWAPVAINLSRVTAASR